MSGGLVLQPTGSLDGGLFLAAVNESSQPQPVARMDHAFVFRVVDEQGTVYYHWLVRS